MLMAEPSHVRELTINVYRLKLTKCTSLMHPYEVLTAITRHHRWQRPQAKLGGYTSYLTIPTQVLLLGLPNTYHLPAGYIICDLRAVGKSWTL